MNLTHFKQGAKLKIADGKNGFTLLEVLIVLILVGVLAAIATPSWIRFLANRQITTARDELHQGIQKAQADAMHQKRAWRFSLREQNNQWEWAAHADAQSWQDVPAWEPLNNRVILESADTTLARKEGIYYVRFNFRGEVVYRLSTVTVASKNGFGRNRCVVISTLLGATRLGKQQTYPNGNNRYCY